MTLREIMLLCISGLLGLGWLLDHFYQAGEVNLPTTRTEVPAKKPQPNNATAKADEAAEIRAEEAQLRHLLGRRYQRERQARFEWEYNSQQLHPGGVTYTLSGNLKFSDVHVERSGEEFNVSVKVTNDSPDLPLSGGGMINRAEDENGNKLNFPSWKDLERAITSATAGQSQLDGESDEEYQRRIERAKKEVAEEYRELQSGESKVVWFKHISPTVKSAKRGKLWISCYDGDVNQPALWILNFNFPP